MNMLPIIKSVIGQSPTPAQVTNFTATALAGFVRLAWDEVTGATNYQYRWTIGSIFSDSDWTSLDTTDTSVDIANGDLSSLNLVGHNLRFQVRAEINGSFGPASRTDFSGTLRAALAKVTGLTLRNPTQNSIQLGWTRISGVTSYQYRQRVSGASEWDMWVTLGGGARTQSHTVSGLMASTTYEYQVRGKYNDSFGPASDTVSATTAESPEPATPTGLGLTVVDHDTLRASWTAVSGATYYEVKIATSEVRLGAASWQRVASGTSFDFDGLSPSTEYFVVARSGKSTGTSDPTSAVSATTSARTLPMPVESYSGMGIFERVGNAVDFGLTDIDQVQGLAAIGNTLYMCAWEDLRRGDNFSHIYSVDLITGVATRVIVGISPRSLLTGLAAIGNTLYAVDIATDALDVVDLSARTTRRVGSVRQFGVSGADVPRGLAAIGNTLYLTITNAAGFNYFLYTVNTTTGVATQIGGVLGIQAYDLASIGNTLYAISGSDLYTLNTTTGVPTRVGTVSEFGVNEGRARGLASIGNRLYMVGQSREALFVSPAGVTALFSSVPGIVTARTVNVQVLLNQAVTGFAIADLLLSAVSGNGSTGVMVTNVAVDREVTNGYIATVSLPVDVSGVVRLGIASAAMVTVGSGSQQETVQLTGNTVDITYDTVTPISATMSVPMPGRLDTTATSRVTFERAINVNSFEAGDIAVTAIAGVVVNSVVRVNIGGTTDDTFDITFALPTNRAGTVSFDITGTVTEGTVEREVTATQQDFLFNTVPRTIDARFSNLPTQPVGGNFTVDVDFVAESSANVISGFTASDVALSGDTTGLTDYTVTGVPGNPQKFRIHFTPSANTNGEVTIGVNGIVQVDGVDHGVSISAVQITWDTRDAISATWADIDGIKRGDFAIRLLFDGTDPIEIPDSTHFTITRISGATIADLGISDFTIAAIRNSNDFMLSFTPAQFQEGVFEIDVGGRFNVGASGSQVMREVSIPAARISVNTTNTVPEPTFDPATIPTPQWMDEPLQITEPGVDHDFILNFGENIRGLTLSDIIEKGVTNRRLTLWRSVAGVLGLHFDDTPASFFVVRVRINANQHGNLTLTLKPNSVVSVDDGNMGPIVPIQSQSVPFDTRPVETPTPDILSVVFPEGVQTAPFDAIITFDMPVTGVSVNAFMLVSDEDNPTAVIESVTRVDMTNSYRVRIVPQEGRPLSLVTLRLVGGLVDSA